ncbi:MAG TPA: substrate-binding domain-containing protein [Devosia sp.]|nr:substrate-binding domain-containing protein [Devosia sp.]
MNQLGKVARVALLASAVALAAGSVALAAGPTAADLAAGGGQDAVFAKLAALKDVAAAGKGKIAVLLPDTQSSARWAGVDAPGFDAAFKAMGLTANDYTIVNAQGSPQTQQTQAEQAITQGASVILIANLDSGSAAAIEAEAKSQGIVSIDYDRLTLNGDAAYYVSFDNVAVGKLQGQGLVAALKDWNVKNPNIFELGGSPTDNNATLFEQGYDSVLQPLYDGKQATLVGRIRVPNWDNQQGATMFEQALQANSQINAVLAANDGLGQSAISILKNNKVPPKTVPVTGQDATLQGIQNILAGYQYMTVYKPIYEEVAAAAVLAVYARAGQTPDASLLNGTVDAQNHKTPSLLLTPISVTASNIQSTVIADKFIDPAQLCSGDFAKACSDAGIK